MLRLCKKKLWQSNYVEQRESVHSAIWHATFCKWLSGTLKNSFVTGGGNGATMIYLPWYPSLTQLHLSCYATQKIAKKRWRKWKRWFDWVLTEVCSSIRSSRRICRTQFTNQVSQNIHRWRSCQSLQLHLLEHHCTQIIVKQDWLSMRRVVNVDLLDKSGMLHNSIRMQNWTNTFT